MLAAFVPVSGAVDVNTVGTYSITYDYTDAAGNAATQVTRTVTVNAAVATPDYELVRGQSLVPATDLAVLVPGDFYLAYAVISGTRYYLDVVSYSAGNITVSVPATFPLLATEGSALLYVDRARLSA